MKPIIAIVGRPNVGKSTLFNRIMGYRKAIAEDTPGVTRDRNYGEFDYRGRTFVLVDTGGFEPAKADGFSPLILKQIEVSLEEATAIVFLLDGKEGILPEDVEISNNLRKYGLPVLYVISKVDSIGREQAILPDFYALGVDTFYPVSAAHGLGISDLLDAVYDAAGTEEGAEAAQKGDSSAPEAEDHVMHITLVGRPNTGKSSLTNRLIGQERMIVSEVPGTTRDSIDTKILYKNKEIVLIDTAGLRRKSKVSLKVEGYSVASALRSVDRADVVNLVIDAQEGVSHQDAAIAHTVLTRGKGMTIVVNKWDLLQSKVNQSTFIETVREKIPHADYCPIIFTSALTGRHVTNIIDADIRVYDELHRRIATPRLNQVFEDIFQHFSIPNVKGKQIRILYVHQAQTPPPTFIFFANFPELIPDHYKKYLENALRERYSFQGAPVRLVFRKK